MIGIMIGPVFRILRQFCMCPFPVFIPAGCRVTRPFYSQSGICSKGHTPASIKLCGRVQKCERGRPD